MFLLGMGREFYVTLPIGIQVAALTGLDQVMKRHLGRHSNTFLDSKGILPIYRLVELHFVSNNLSSAEWAHAIIITNLLENAFQTKMGPSTLMITYS